MTTYNSKNCVGAKTYDVDAHEYIKGVISINTDTGYVHCKDEHGFESIIRFKLILTVPPTGNPTEFHCNSRINEIDETMKEMACICMEKFKAFQAAGFNESQALELCKVTTIHKIKTRQEIAVFIESQFSVAGASRPSAPEKGQQHHYGKQELRELMDFIFGGAPKTKDEEIQ